jgi:hemolysin activation/secretion protein
MSDTLGNWRAGGTLSLNGVLGDTAGLRLSAYRALDSGSFAYGAVSLSQPISTDGLMLTVDASTSRDVPLEGILQSIDFEGESQTAALTLSWPLIRSRPENLTLSAALRMSNTESRSLGTTLTQDRVRLLELAATWDVTDRWSGLNLLRLSMAQGLDIAGATDDSSLLKSRANGSASFTSVGFSAARWQELTDQISLYAAIDAQAALGSPMLAASECSWGGQGGGRAYDAGVLSGDHCASGIVELRVDTELSGLDLQLYGFADAAVVSQKGQLQPGEKRHEQASSAGAGLRLSLDHGVSLNLEIAVPLRERYSDGGDASPRAFISLTARF